MLIPLSEIAVVKRQRKKMDQKKLESLAQNIKLTKERTGKALIHPINVRPRRDDDRGFDGKPVTRAWVLLTGGRRLAAHVLLGWPDIEARNFEDLDPIEQKVVELYENLDREDLNYLDELEAKNEILRIRTAEGKTQAEVAEELGEDKGNFSKDIKLFEEIKANPKLRLAGTKNAARKASEHHKLIEIRVNTIKQVDVADLKSKLFIANAQDYVRTLADNSVDLHMWDPPWAMGYKSASDVAVKTRGQIVLGKYDDSAEANLDWITDVIPHVVRTVKPSGWVCVIFATTGMNWLRAHFMGACKTHGNYAQVTYDEDSGEFRRPFKHCVHATDGRECVFLEPELMPWIWYRPNSRNIGQWPDRHAKHVYESLLVIPGSDKARLVLTGRPDVLMHDAVYEDRLHEMQKPHALLCDLISRFTLPGELVVDLSFGSGAHLAAAADLNRDFRGCEKNAELLSGALALTAQFYRKRNATAAKPGNGAVGSTGGVAKHPSSGNDELAFSAEEAASIE